jgi:hypothetical protein
LDTSTINANRTARDGFCTLRNDDIPRLLLRDGWECNPSGGAIGRQTNGQTGFANYEVLALTNHCQTHCIIELEKIFVGVGR